MTRSHVPGETVRTREWAELGARLEAVNPGRVDAVLDALREMVYAQEVLAMHAGREEPSAH